MNFRICYNSPLLIMVNPERRFSPPDEGGVAPYEIEPQTEQMPEEELGNLLAAFGNHEAKALLLVAMAPENIYSDGDMHKMMLKQQGDTLGWKIGNRVPF